MEPVRNNLCCWCGATPCEWENYAEELWLAAGRVQRKLLRASTAIARCGRR
ncbi:hypothetical protein PR003_g29941 [Phytophthora rubi]|uniref:Uncharacterized protein n=1 Tax=Phytophthora rubi TaxID=129364 RepID=A0A6A4BFN2_9STRA|nr:hypothetical protein PR003_g29941 [Phytophthora rubi]